MNNIKFLLEGIKNFKEVGTLTRSGSAMCKRVAAELSNKNCQVIVELGAGDGVITKHLLKVLSPEGKLLAFEINENLCAQMNENIDDHRLIIVNKGAEHLQEELLNYGVTEIDAVVSAIPFLVVPKKLANQILTSCFELLKSGGDYLQVHYARKLKSFYKGIFGNIYTYFIPFNLPPAYLFHCKKESVATAV